MLSVDEVLDLYHLTAHEKGLEHIQTILATVHYSAEIKLKLTRKYN